MRPERPRILVFGGVDPSGAGLQADIETCLSHRCHALPIATALTVQNTASLLRVEPVEASLIEDQINHLLADCAPPAACKIGLIPTPEIAHVIESVLRSREADFPVVLDPVLAAGSGARLAEPGMERELRDCLMPLCTLVKPNFSEAQLLADGIQNQDEIGRRLSSGPGCRYALLTGTDAPGARDASHFLFRGGEIFARYRYPLRSGRYHGTGCTLTTALSCMLGWGASCEIAIGAALDFTWRAVRDAYGTGGVQSIPDRSCGFDGYRVWP